MTRTYELAIAGATGAVGVELLRLLEERDFPVGRLRLLASSRSAGRRMRFRGEEIVVEELTDDALEGVELALFSCGGERSRRFVPPARARGTVIVDNSSAFRMLPDVPLVLPELNPAEVDAHTGLLAVPNCTTIVFLMAAGPLHREAGLRRAVVSSYQSASGAGQAALDEYDTQLRAAASGATPLAEVLPRVLLGNVIPLIGEVEDDGWTREERKMEEESRRILAAPALRVACTCVRVPVRRAHSVSAALEFERPLSPERARAVLGGFPGVELMDGCDPPHYPTPLDASGRLEVLVGRIRTDASCPNGLLLWAAGDQLLKGAAWNAVQIAELLVERRRL